MNKGLFKLGVIGSVITALCCFTPILVVLLGALGLSTITGYTDYVLLPLLGVFLAIVAVSLFSKSGGAT